MRNATARRASAVLALVIAGCGHTQPAGEPANGQARPAPRTPPMLDAQFSAGRMTRPFADLIASAELAPGEAFKIVELGRDAQSSHHVVALRDREPLHRHDLHDLLVVVMEGHGQMRIGGEERAIGENSIVYVPRGTPHAMRNTSGRPLTGYAVFTPPFDGQDRVLEPEQPAGP